MAKSPNDLVPVLDVLMGTNNLPSSLRGSWEGLSVGFVDPSLWQPADFVVEPNEQFTKQTVRPLVLPGERMLIISSSLPWTKPQRQSWLRVPL